MTFDRVIYLILAACLLRIALGGPPDPDTAGDYNHSYIADRLDAIQEACAP